MTTRKRISSLLLAANLIVVVPKSAVSADCQGEVLPPPSSSVLKCGPDLGVFVPEATYRSLREKEINSAKIPLLEREVESLREANKLRQDHRPASMFSKPGFWAALIGAGVGGLVLGLSLSKSSIAVVK